MLYFDNNATTCVAPEVADALARALLEVYGNASSAHTAGQTARRELEQARRTIADALDCDSAEFVFTSGGTEADNLAILGPVRNVSGAKKHVVTSVIEHPAVLEPCRQLEREGVAVTYLDVDREGRLDPEAIRRSIRPETVLISVMHANNETGTIQPIPEIAAIISEFRAAGQNIFFHSDGVQVFGKLDGSVRQLGVDLYSVTGHKLHAPKGIGGLYVRKGVPLRGIQYGGRHERERRAGTEDVPAAIAFARAVELCSENAGQTVKDLRDGFERTILQTIPDVEINGSKDHRLPTTSNLLFRGVSGEALLIALDMKGMAVSTGAACSSGAVEPSHVLLAMGGTREEARCSIRFSFCRYNTTHDIEQLIQALAASVGRLRSGTRVENHACV